MRKTTRRGILAGLAASVATPLFAELASSPIPLRRPAELGKIDITRAAEALIAKAGLGGQVSFAVLDGQSGLELGARAATEPMAPASTAKAITAAYALDHLGPAYRFRTQLMGTGPLRQGKLEGDLILAGGGDPSLSSDGLALLLDQLEMLGVTSVSGKFLVWPGALPYVAEIDPGQPDHLAYNPAVSGLNLNYNRVHFQWKKQSAGYALTLDARSDHRVPPVHMVTMSTSDRSVPIFTVNTEDDTGLERWTVARPALGQAGSRWLPVRGAAKYSAEVLRTLAAGRNLSLSEPEMIDGLPAEAVPIAMHQSGPLTDVVRDMLKYSTNLTAEVIGLTASKAKTAEVPVDLVSSAAEMNDWTTSIGMTDAALVDHSGLGPASRVTARDMAVGLHHIGIQGPLWPLLKQIGLNDASGRPERFELRAKTGTLNFVSCLVGYIRRPDAAPLVFAILTAEPERRAAIKPGDEERPQGALGWTRRSRALQYDLVRLWAHHA